MLFKKKHPKMVSEEPEKNKQKHDYDLPDFYCTIEYIISE